MTRKGEGSEKLHDDSADSADFAARGLFKLKGFCSIADAILK
jgi:hypothetical protein